MATKAARELRALDRPELERRLQEAQNDLMGTRFGLATLQTQNTARLSQARRQIARILTILAEMDREA
jgi:large subunit ribosomal protein L29